ncbi:MAG: hypothetical protein ACI4M6_01470 [Christensenellaceae bacterium]
MNIIFCAFLIASIITLLIHNPQDFLTAISNAGTASAELMLTLLGIYAMWMGIFEIAKASRVTDKIARLIRAPIRRLFGKTGQAEEEIALNITANLFGISAIATASGINAITELEKQRNVYAQNMLFVLASTSLQLLPFSVISLRAVNGSASPYDIILPTLLTTLLSSVSGALLVKIFVRNENI